jgi:acetate kinase
VNVLVLNVGSSTLKFQLVRTDEKRFASDGDERLARGQVERIGGEAVWSFRVGEGETVKGTAPLRDHRAAIEYLLRWMVDPASGVAIGSVGDIDAVGHRVVHGGERFSTPSPSTTRCSAASRRPSTWRRSTTRTT